MGYSENRQRREERIREEYVKVLDYLPEGLTSLPVYKRYPIGQTVGCEYFVLLEVTPKPGVDLKGHEQVYVGEGERDKVKTIKRRIKYDELTGTAKTELPHIISEIVTENEKKFVDFFNKSKAISLKHHQLELLPKIGKKQLIKLLEEREAEPFSSFEDIDKRVKGLPGAKKLIVERIIEEIEGPAEHRLFVPDFGRS